MLQICLRVLVPERGKSIMADYKKMYAILCGAVSDSLDILEKSSKQQAISNVQKLLQQAMMSAEDIYIVTVDDEEYETFG